MWMGRVWRAGVGWRGAGGRAHQHQPQTNGRRRKSARATTSSFSSAPHLGLLWSTVGQNKALFSSARRQSRESQPFRPTKNTIQKQTRRRRRIVSEACSLKSTSLDVPYTNLPTLSPLIIASSDRIFLSLLKSCLFKSYYDHDNENESHYLRQPSSSSPPWRSKRRAPCLPWLRDADAAVLHNQPKTDLRSVSPEIYQPRLLGGLHPRTLLKSHSYNNFYYFYSSLVIYLNKRRKRNLATYLKKRRKRSHTHVQTQ